MKLASIGVAALVGMSSIAAMHAAMAADIPVKASPPAPASDPWAGGYVGVNAGYGAGGQSSDTLTTNFIPTFGLPPSSVSMTIAPSGWFGGAQGGYGWQHERVVIGVEGDFQYSGGQNASYCGFLACPSIAQLTPSSSGAIVTQGLDWFSTARARLGYDAGPALIYGTVGLAVGEVSTGIATSFNGVPPTTASASFHDVRVGWALGGGVEAPVWGNWTFKAEYLHVAFGGIGDGFTVPAALLPALGGAAERFSLDSSVRYDVIRVGVNYRFNGAPSPGDAAAGALPSLFTKAPLAGVAPHDWSGIYAGANLGYAAGSQSMASLTSTIIFAPPLNFGDRVSLPPTGILGGGQLGANKQFGAWVVGLEGDIQGTGASASYCGFLQCAPTVPTVTLTPGSWETHVGQNLDWFATLRARVGVASGNWLFYATGGPAWGRTSTAFSVIYNGTPATLAATTFNDTRFGYAAGGGVEAALWRDWTFKAEYLFLDLGSVTDGMLVPPAIAAGFPQTFTLRSAVHDNIFRVGANYRFSSLPF